MASSPETVARHSESEVSERDSEDCHRETKLSRQLNKIKELGERANPGRWPECKALIQEVLEPLGMKQIVKEQPMRPNRVLPVGSRTKRLIPRNKSGRKHVKAKRLYKRVQSLYLYKRKKLVQQMLDGKTDV